ncbi:MAG: bifunctional diguanylate cyclase/phosphodiesterase, partial [Pseudomonadota bacterium]
VASRERNGGELTAMHIDLDRFKHVNDTMGHAAGDHVLVVVAEILRAHLRSTDVIARVGGDEFFVLLPSGPQQIDPEKLSDRLIKEICKPIPFEDKFCRLGASIGIAKTSTVPPDELVVSSDFALYKAKESGRGKYSTFGQGDLERLHAAKSASDELVRAIEQEEFIPYYQVQIDALENRVVALEVLARWNHPEKGILPPSEFLEYANELQMLADIDAMIFHKALEECAEPLRELLFPPTLSFNVGLQRLSDDRFIHYIDHMEYPFPVALELGEVEFFDQEHQHARRIEMLRARGITIEVDDFGSGRASVVGLREHKADRLKLDHRLVLPIVDSVSARKLVQSVIDVGRALEIPVTAEGIESQAHAELLAKMGCDRLQGYHFAHPLPLDELLEQLHAREAMGSELRAATIVSN